MTARASVLKGLEQAKDLLEKPADKRQTPFSERVQNLRKRLGLTQAGFEAEFGVPVATIRNWEQGRRRNVGAAAELLISMIEEDPQGMAKAAKAATASNSARAASG